MKKQRPKKNESPSILTSIMEPESLGLQRLRIRKVQITSQSQHDGPPSRPEQSQQQQQLNHDFRSEAARLSTFTRWPLRSPSPNQLANAGFIYTGYADIVRCAFCGERIRQWQPVRILKIPFEVKVQNLEFDL